MSRSVIAASRLVLWMALTTLCVHATVIAVKVAMHPSHSLLAVFRVGELEKGGDRARPPFVFDEGYPLEQGGFGTDGQQYLFIAHDPLLQRGDMVPFIDAPRYRYGRILLPGLAATVCAGNSRCIPRAILGFNLVFAAGIGALLAALVLARKKSVRFAMLLATGGGLVCATDIAGVEVAAQFFGLLGLFAWTRERRWLAALALTAAALARETYVLVPAGIVLAELLAGRENKAILPSGASWTKVFPLLFAPLPAVLWMFHLRRVLPPDDAGGGLQNLSFPLEGPVRVALGFVRAHSFNGHVVLTALVGVPLLAMIFLHLASLRRDRSGLAIATGLFCLLGLCSSYMVWTSPGGFARGLDFLYPGIVLCALARDVRLPAWLALSSSVHAINIVLDHVVSR